MDKIQKIERNGRTFLRFKIGDVFETISGKGSFNKIKKEGLCSDTYDEEQGFIYPFYDASTKNDHVKGYCKEFNFEGKSIKVVTTGIPGAGETVFNNGKCWLGAASHILINDDLTNEYTSEFLSRFIPNYVQGTTGLANVRFSNYKDEYIEIPENHEELAKVVKRVLEYKQLSKQLSKQMEDYKLAILQESENAIKYWKETGQHDKYISFKIGDEFEIFSGNKLYSEFEKKGNASKKYTEKFPYKFYDGSTSNNHIKGYITEFNFEGTAIKVSRNGDAGRTNLISGKVFISDHAYVLKSNRFNNYFMSTFLDKYLPKFNQGTSIPGCQFTYYKDQFIEIPNNHKEISNVIKKLNEWISTVNETTKHMEQYIDGVLELCQK